MLGIDTGAFIVAVFAVGGCALCVIICFIRRLVKQNRRRLLEMKLEQEQARAVRLAQEKVDAEEAWKKTVKYVLPDGTQILNDGTQIFPDGRMLLPDGTLLNPDGSPARKKKHRSRTKRPAVGRSIANAWKGKVHLAPSMDWGKMAARERRAAPHNPCTELGAVEEDDDSDDSDGSDGSDGSDDDDE
eukprot:g1713.t1